MKSQLEKGLMDEKINNLSEVEERTMKEHFEVGQKLRNKQREMFENEQYQSLISMYKQRDQMQNRLGKMRKDRDKMQDDLSDMQKVKDLPALGGSSGGGRGGSSFRSQDSRINLFTTRIAAIETELRTLPGEIATLERSVQPLQTECDEIKDEVNRLQTEVDKISGKVEDEMNEALEKNPEIQELKRERRNAEEKMLRVAEDVKGQIKANHEEQYDQYLAERLDVLGKKLIGSPLSEEEQARTKLKTREYAIEVPIQEKAYMVSEAYSFCNCS